MNLTSTIIVSVVVGLIYAFIIKPKKEKKAKEAKENPTEGILSYSDESNVKISGDKQILLKAPSDIEEYTVPDTVSTIQEGAFQDCTSLHSINLGTIYHIEANAFRGCINLKNIVFPKHMGSIGAHAFRNCGSLVDITIPDGVTTIGNSAFENCSGLQIVKLPAGMKKFGTYVFAECYNISKIIVPKGEKSRYEKLLSNNLTDKIVESTE